MSGLTIDQVFWNIQTKVKYNHAYEHAFLNTVGRITGAVMMGPVGCIAWELGICFVNHCYGHEPLHERMERIGKTDSQRKQFVIKLSEDLGYKDNWRKMYTDLEGGVFDLNESEHFKETITK
jgi:hypothetical protein